MARRYYLVTNHEGGHPAYEPGVSSIRGTNWLAFNPEDRKVLIEVVANAAGFTEFETFYGARATQIADGALPQPRKWVSLIGDREPDEDDEDEQKHTKRLRRLKQRMNLDPDQE